MATKTTGSGRAPGLETWNPNIKAPGINKGTGAYFRGDIAGEGDYTQMNDAIQSSILQASKDVGKAFKTNENDPSNPSGKGSLLSNKRGDGPEAADADMTVGKISSVFTENTTAALDNIVGEVAAEETRGRAFRRTNKNKPVTFKHLTRKGKIKANKRADEIGGFNASIKDQIENGWISANPGEIDWGNWGKHKNAHSFFSHLIHGDANIKYEQKNGTTVATWMEGNTKKTITKTELDVARDMWGSNKEGVASYEARYKKDGALIAKNFTATQNLVKSGQLSQDEADTDMNTRIEKAVQDNNTFEDRQYIWNNVLANTNMFQGARTAEYDPEATLTYIDKEGKQQSLLHKDIVDNYKEAKLREYAGFPPKAQMKPETKNNNNNNNSSSGGGNERVFNDIMMLSRAKLEKIDLVQTLKNDLIEGSALDKSFFPSKASVKDSVEREEYNTLKEAWNRRADKEKPNRSASSLPSKTLQDVVEFGLKEQDENGNVNWDNYSGSSSSSFNTENEDFDNVWNSWKDLYADEFGSKVSNEEVKKEFDAIIDMTGGKIGGEDVDPDNPAEVSQNKKGETVITFYTKKGSESLEPQKFNVSTDRGRRNMYAALTQGTDAKYNVNDAAFTAMYNEYLKKIK